MTERNDAVQLFLAEQARARRACGGGISPVRARVRCAGRWHQVLLTRAGRLRLRDHPAVELRRLLAAEQLGARPCPCLAVLRAWRRFCRSGADQDEQALPEALRDAAWERHRFL